MSRFAKFCVCILSGLLALPLVNGLAEEHQFEIEVLRHLDYPGTGNSTTPNGISNGGAIGGFFVDSAGAERAFIRFSNGKFSPPIIEPNDTGNFTFGRGINSSRTLVGYFFNVADNVYHGYLYSKPNFTQFDLGSSSTFLLAINDAGDFGGSFGGFFGPRQGFIDVNGNVILINVPGANITDVGGINRFREVAGDYFDGTATHGFFRDVNGTLTFPIDVPGATSTLLLGLNDRGWIVGRYVDSAGHEHGFALKRPSTLVFFDFQGAAHTSLNGINNNGRIAGRYTDASGVRHGFLAKIKGEDDE